MKTLPINYPDITAYPHHANLFSILNGIDKEEQYKLPWLCNNYVQLEYESGVLDFSIGFDILPLLENCPWIIKDSISFELVNKKWSNIVEFIIDAIDANCYVYMEVDEYYIKEYDNYRKNHYTHTIFIYGYDEINKEFYIADFFNNRKYYFARASFEEIKNGYENIITTFLFGIYLFRKKDNANFTYKYNRSALVKNLEDFLFSNNSKERNMVINYKRVMPHLKVSSFGISVFGAIRKDMQKNNYVDMTTLYVVKEHIKILEIIVFFLAKNGLIDDWEKIYLLLKDVYKKSEICISFNIKYQITKKTELLYRISNMLKEIENSEGQIAQKLLSNIQTEPSYNTFDNALFIVTQVGLRTFNVTYEGALFITNDNTSYVQVTFWGIGIIYVADKGNTYGKCEVYLDGEKYAVLSLKSDDLKAEQEVLCIDNLPNSLHTIRIRGVDKEAINLRYFKNIKYISELNNPQTIFLRFVKLDKETMGNWKGRYGAYGYVIPDNEWNYPIYGDIAIQDKNLYVNLEIKRSDFLLQSPQNCERVNKCYYCENQEVVNVIVTGEKKRKVTFYLLDWTPSGEATCCVTVRSLSTKEDLDSRIVENMRNGVYITYEVLGAVQFVFQYKDLVQERIYGDFYGAFFD